MNYTLATNLSVKKIEDTIFVLDRDHSVLHSFNDTGAFIWERLQRSITLDALPAEISAAFETDAPTARTDLDEFLDTLESKHLLSLRT